MNKKASWNRDSSCGVGGDVIGDETCNNNAEISKPWAT